MMKGERWKVKGDVPQGAYMRASISTWGRMCIVIVDCWPRWGVAGWFGRCWKWWFRVFAVEIIAISLTVFHVGGLVWAASGLKLRAIVSVIFWKPWTVNIVVVWSVCCAILLTVLRVMCLCVSCLRAIFFRWDLTILKWNSPCKG